MKRFINLLFLIALITALSNNTSALALGAAHPILVVTNDSAAEGKFGSYLAEILIAEGINAFDTAKLSTVLAATLSPYDLVILGRGALSAAQASMLTNYVNSGGHLVAMRPDAQLYPVVGLSNSTAGVSATHYIKILDTASFQGELPMAGLSNEAFLQLHTSADQHPLANGAVMLAELYTDPATSTTFPAVIGNGYGSGLAASFTYDLSENIILTRQGNPVNVNTDVDGDGVIRTTDLFQAAGNAAPWVDLNRVRVPQADIQQRFFARLVKQLVKMPIPQLWYFPGTAKTMLILTSDAHGQSNIVYQDMVDTITAYGGKDTFYISMTSDPDDTSINNWRSQGFGFGIHPYSYLPDSYNPIYNLSEGYVEAVAWWNFQHASDAYSRTVRNHQLAWTGWTDAVGYESAGNIALDANNYAYGHWLKNGSTWEHGYINGSGLPMKFAQLDGTILPVFQQTTQLVDEQLFGASIQNISLYNCFLNPQPFECGNQAVTITHDLINASQLVYHSAIMAQFHLDYWNYGDVNPWVIDTLDTARSNSIPIWNADQWLNFTESRYAANFSNLNWNSATGNLTFNINPTIDLTTMLPESYQGHSLVSVKSNGTPITTTPVNINGVDLAFFNVAPGAHTYTANYYRAGQADVSVVTGSSATTATAGDPFTYIWTVRNNGPDSAANVQLTDTLPGNLAFVSAKWNTVNNCVGAYPVVCDLGTLASGGSATVTIVTTINPLARGSLANMASVTSGTSDPTTGNNSISKIVTVNEAVNLKVTLAANINPAYVGKPMRYTVNVSNQDSSTAPSVLAVVQLPAGASYLGTFGAGEWVCGQTGGVVNCALPQLTKGTAPPIQIDILAPVSSGSITAAATVSFSGIDLDLSDNSATLQQLLMQSFFLPTIKKN